MELNWTNLTIELIEFGVTSHLLSKVRFFSDVMMYKIQVQIKSNEMYFLLIS